MVVLQMADVEAASGDYELLEPATYAAYLDDFEIKRKDSASDPYAALEFVIDEDGRNAHVWTNASTSAKSIKYLKRTLLSLGADLDTLDDPDGFELEDVLNDCRSARVLLTLKQVDYQKRDGSPGRKNEVTRIQPEE